MTSPINTGGGAGVSKPTAPDSPNVVQPTGVSKAQADANLKKVSEEPRNREENRKTDPETGRPLLEVELEAPVSTSENEKAPTEDASEKKRDTETKAPVRSVAQLRDRGIAEGVMPTSQQIEEMRKIETDGEAELSKQIRKPNSATVTSKK